MLGRMFRIHAVDLHAWRDVSHSCMRFYMLGGMFRIHAGDFTCLAGCFAFIQEILHALNIPIARCKHVKVL